MIEQAEAVLSQFVGEGDYMVLKYAEGEVAMRRGTSDGARCVKVRLRHNQTGNSFELGFSLNGLSAFVILAEEMLKEPR